MNILFAVGSYWPNQGGVQMVTQYLAEGLAARGHDVTIVTKQVIGSPIEEEYHGVKIIRFYEKDFLKYRHGDKKGYQNYLIEKSKELDAIIVVCSNNFVANWFYPIFDKISCKKILYQHGMYDGKFHFDKCNSLSRFIKSLMLTPFWECYHRIHWNKMKQFDGVVHLFKNDSSYNYFVNKGYYQNHVIVNSCNDVFFDKNKDENIVKKYKISNGYYIYVANYCSRKDQIRAVKCFVKSQCKDKDLVLIGSSENTYFNKLKKYVDSFPEYTSRIHLLTNISREDTIQLIKNSFSCFMTSNNEFLPISIIECMAFGIPFISTDVGVVSKIPGGVVCRRDEDLEYWLDYYDSHPDFVKSMGTIASDYAIKNCLLEDRITELENIIKK